MNGFPPKEDKQHKKIKHQIMSGGLLFWILYYSALEAFKGGTLCERVQQALFVRVVVQEMVLFELKCKGKEPPKAKM